MGFGRFSLGLMFGMGLLAMGCQSPKVETTSSTVSPTVDTQMTPGKPLDHGMSLKIQGLFAHAQVNRILQFANENVNDDAEYQSLIVQSPYLAAVVQEIPNLCTVHFPDSAVSPANGTVTQNLDGSIQGSDCPISVSDSKAETFSFSNVSDDKKSFDLVEHDSRAFSLAVEDSSVVQSASFSGTDLNEVRDVQFHGDPDGSTGQHIDVAGAGTMHLVGLDVPIEIRAESYVATKAGQVSEMNSMVHLKLMVDGEAVQIALHRQLVNGSNSATYFVNGIATTKTAIDSLLSGSISFDP